MGEVNFTDLKRSKSSVRSSTVYHSDNSSREIENFHEPYENSENNEADNNQENAILKSQINLNNTNLEETPLIHNTQENFEINGSIKDTDLHNENIQEKNYNNNHILENNEDSNCINDFFNENIDKGFKSDENLKENNFQELDNKSNKNLDLEEKNEEPLKIIEINEKDLIQ